MTGLRRGRGVSLGTPPLRVQHTPNRQGLALPWPVALVVTVVRLLVTAAAWVGFTVARYPITSAAVVLVVAVWRAHWLAAFFIACALVTLVGIGVACWRPAVFAAWVTLPADRYRRRRRLSRSWARLCRLCGLDMTETDPATGGRISWVPRLGRLRWIGPGKAVLSGLVTVPAGSTVADVKDATDRLASAAGARACTVRADGPNTAVISFLFGDPLAAPVPPQPLPPACDLSAVPVGASELGGPWSLRVAGTHVLIAGATGSGKSGVVWSLLRGLAGEIAAGRVEVWAIDGKGGIELAAGRPLFSRFATNTTDGLALLAEAREAMQARPVVMAGHARKHTPTTGMPLVVVLVDEVALMTAYEPDRKRREQAVADLSLLATQGRALGFVVVATVQDPRKDVIALRHLFPTRIGLRLDTASETDMVLGDHAAANGAACHTIPETTPGVAYVKVDGRRDTLRVRASYLDDDAVTALANTHPTPNPAPLGPAGPGTPGGPASTTSGPASAAWVETNPNVSPSADDTVTDAATATDATTDGASRSSSTTTSSVRMRSMPNGTTAAPRSTGAKGAKGGKTSGRKAPVTAEDWQALRDHLAATHNPTTPDTTGDTGDAA